MRLKVHQPGAEPWPIGDFPGYSLGEVITEVARLTAEDAGSDLLASPEQNERDALADRVAREMSRALWRVGDSYRAPDGVLYTLEA